MEKLIGDWSIADCIIQSDGSWTPGPGAEWTFRYTLDGYAIEDIWVQPRYSTPLEDEADRTVGINIRKYDAAAGKWIMAWTTKAPGGFQMFSALSTPDEVVMIEDEPNHQGVFRRISFYNMTAMTFAWRMETSPDRRQWTEVYRISGMRRSHDGANAAETPHSAGCEI